MIKKQVSETKEKVLIRSILESGVHIFSTEDCIRYVPGADKSKDYLRQILMRLERGGWINRLRPGFYSINSDLLGNTVIHEFEIAMHLTDKTCISHLSAFHLHGFTDQIPKDVYLTSPEGSVPRQNPIKIEGVSYRFIQVNPARFFGIQSAWKNGVKIQVTDPEKTLIDGITKPKYCGGFLEVLNAYKLQSSKINLEKIMGYALKTDSVTSKRLGWVLENSGISIKKLEPLRRVVLRSRAKLVSHKLQEGTLSKTWGLLENIS